MLLEQLEQRSMLSLNNFPQISDLLNPSDTVVRLQTNFGDIDFEMFDQAAPITVTNFLKYVRDGDFDRTFFHRYATNPADPSNPNSTETPFVLQGGGFRLKNPTTSLPLTADGGTGTNQAWEHIPTDPPITNEFNQSNLIRTVSMAKLGGQLNSATSQFFINLANNTSLDGADAQGTGGFFTVFARIANDASWNVVQSIITMATRPFHATASGNLFDDVPTTNGFTGTNVADNQLVTIADAEIIKPQGVAAFYTYRVYYPEGFAGSTINEFLPMGNPGSTAVNYQVIARAETRDALPNPLSDFWYRDKVISTGTIAPNRRAGITISTFSAPVNNLVPEQGKPYAIEVWATGPISAELSHYDFGSATLEAFTQSPATTWTLPDIRKGTDIRDFVVWDNTADVPATITLNFYKGDGTSPIVVTVTTEAFRRGGLSIGDTAALPDLTNYSLQITSTQPIIAAMTHYKTSGADKGGATQLGITGAGFWKGVLPFANNGPAGSGVQDTLSILNPNGAAAIVTIIARFSDGSPDFTITTGDLIVPAGARSSFTMPDVAALQGKNFSILYRTTSTSVPIFVSSLHVEHGDVASNPFAYTAATHHDFGEGFMNAQRAGNDLFESLGIYNPNGSFFGAQPQDALVTVRFLFTDGFVLSEDFTVGADGNLLIDLTTYAPLLAQNANNRYFFSVDVVSDIPVVAMMRHYDTSLGGLQPSGGDSTIGTQRGQVVTLASLGM